MKVEFDLTLEELAEVAQLLLQLRKAVALRAQRPTSAERAAITAGNPIEAIKLVRARLGCGLKEAKDLVEGWRDNI